ncbi:MAG: AraC family transcriptional regulator [Acidobacteriota bacterium]
MSWVQTVLGQAQRQGVDQAALLRFARIDPQDLQRDRWPVDHITRLWRAAAQLTQDPGFGLRAGSHVGPASFNVVSFIVQSAPTLRQALSVVQKYQRLISDAGRFQLLPGPADSWIVYHPRQGDLAFSPHQIEAVLAAFVCFARWLTPQGLQPRLVRFSHARMGPLATYREVFASPIAFDQAYSGLLVDNAILDLPLPQANAQLARVHEQHAAWHLSALSSGEPIDQLVKAWITSHLGPPLPTRPEVARALGLTERTLARRLQAQATSFAQLLDEVRRALAIEQVGQTQKSFQDIAHLLGFAGLSPFYRAFDRWAGMTPGQWRADQRPHSAA